MVTTAVSDPSQGRASAEELKRAAIRKRVEEATPVRVSTAAMAAVPPTTVGVPVADSTRRCMVASAGAVMATALARRTPKGQRALCIASHQAVAAMTISAPSAPAPRPKR